ncbi:unnamed protein product, partial [marine sediment metagenome]
MEGKMNKKIFLLVFTLMFLALPLVSADLNLDNVLQESPSLGNGDYPHIEIVNLFGLGDTIWSGDITSHTDTCGPSCVSEFTVDLKEGKSLADEITFYTLQEDGKTWVEQEIRNYNIKYLNKSIWYYYELGTPLPKDIYTV